LIKPDDWKPEETFVSEIVKTERNEDKVLASRNQNSPELNMTSLGLKNILVQLIFAMANIQTHLRPKFIRWVIRLTGVALLRANMLKRKLFG
jgi:hypothetical protein